MSDIGQEQAREARTPSRSIGKAALVFSAAPLLWSLQMLIGYSLASHACFLRGARENGFPPGWGRTWEALVAINGFCVLVAIGAFALALANRRRNPSTREHPDQEHAPALEHDESLPATFHATAMLTSALFVVAIGFNTIQLWLLTRCAAI